LRVACLAFGLVVFDRSAFAALQKVQAAEVGGIHRMILIGVPIAAALTHLLKSFGSDT
jgi:hypothetical protein